jgi:hypothetical protein
MLNDTLSTATITITPSDSDAGAGSDPRGIVERLGRAGGRQPACRTPTS